MRTEVMEKVSHVFVIFFFCYVTVIVAGPATIWGPRGQTNGSHAAMRSENQKNIQGPRYLMHHALYFFEGGDQC